MKVTIDRFPPHQCAKVAAILGAILVFLFMIPMFFVTWNSGVEGIEKMPWGFMLLMMPLMYAAFFYVTTLIFCLAYNRLAHFTGGVQIEARIDGAANDSKV